MILTTGHTANTGFCKPHSKENLGERPESSLHFIVRLLPAKLKTTDILGHFALVTQ